jgi:hypothetical protein
MGLRDNLRRIGGAMGGEPHADGEAELHVGDPRFDDWSVLRDFEDFEAARAWRQPLTEGGIESVLTADHPLDRFGRGDIALRVRRESWADAQELLADPE